MLTEKSGGADYPITSRRVLLSCPFSQYRSGAGSPVRPKPVQIPSVPLPPLPAHLGWSHHSRPIIEQYFTREEGLC